MDEQIRELHRRQEALETDSIQSGRERFMSRINRAVENDRAGTAGAGLLWLAQNTEAVVEAFEVVLSYSGRGRKSVLQKFAQDLDAEVIGAISMMVVTNNLLSSTPKDAVGREIVDRLMAERRARVLRREAPGLFNYKMRAFKGTADFWFKAKSLWATLRFSDVETESLSMSDSEKTILSAQILQVVQNTLGDLVDEKMHQSPTRRTLYWQFHEDLIAEIKAKNLELCLTAAKPIYRPLLVPPRNWSDEDRGGYWYGLRGDVPLIRAARKWQRKRAEEADLSVVYSALNALQGTAWRINTRVLEVVNHLKGLHKGDVAGIPSMEPVPLPPFPSEVPFESRGPHAKMTDAERALLEGNDEAKKALSRWKAMVHECHAEERERASVAKSFLNTLDVAWDYEAEDRIYFAYNCDWRGRIYPTAEYLHPQGDDIARGLLQFAEGEAVGETGGYWLAVHGATCLDDSPEGRKLSKESFDNRVEWVTDHEAEIVAVAEDPYSNRWWQDADEPFQFLAFCFEWADYVASGKSPEFLSHTGVALDGSANAYQHYAGLWKEQETAESVNLTPTEVPQDVYAKVAGRALDLMQDRFEQGDDLAGKWLAAGLLDRKLAKVPTMSAVYGSRQSQWPHTIERQLRKQGKLDEYREVFGDSWWDARRLVADVLAEAMNDLLPAAMEGRDYLRACARAAAAENKPVEWTVPFTNFPVRQASWKTMSKDVKTWLSGQLCYRQSYVVPTPDLDRHRQQDGIAANFVHSHDAAHLALAVQELAEVHGITSIYTVHDSFAVHPRHVETLRHTLKETFVKLHAEPILERLRAGLEESVDADLPEEVPFGSFDLGMVYAAEYLFG